MSYSVFNQEINDTLKRDYNIDDFFDKKDRVAITDNDDILTKNEEAVFFYYKENICLFSKMDIFRMSFFGISETLFIFVFFLTSI